MERKLVINECSSDKRGQEQEEREGETRIGLLGIVDLNQVVECSAASLIIIIIISSSSPPLHLYVVDDIGYFLVLRI
jgi:hypothetical protein